MPTTNPPKTIDLFRDGYRCRVAKGRLGTVEVLRPAAKVAKDGLRSYTVDAHNLTCGCTGYGWKQSRHGGGCRHITGLGDLIAAQIVECREQKARWESLLVAGEVWTADDQEWTRRNCQAWDDREFGLVALLDWLAGGDMWVPGQSKCGQGGERKAA